MFVKIPLVALLFAAGSVHASDLPGFRRVLVPVSVSAVPGAYGSLWSTELWFRNDGVSPVAIDPLAISDNNAPTPGVTHRLRIFVSPAHAPGQVLHVSEEGFEHVQFDLRLFNRADASSSWGTKLPVVDEAEFASSIVLINVPASDAFRTALRVYSLSEASEIATKVRIETNSGALLAESTLSLTGDPRYAQIISLVDAFPAMRTQERVTVIVTAHHPSAKIWAFAGVTSNATQQVSVIGPH